MSEQLQRKKRESQSIESVIADTVQTNIVRTVEDQRQTEAHEVIQRHDVANIDNVLQRYDEVDAQEINGAAQPIYSELRFQDMSWKQRGDAKKADRESVGEGATDFTRRLSSMSEYGRATARAEQHYTKVYTLVADKYGIPNGFSQLMLRSLTGLSPNIGINQRGIDEADADVARELAEKSNKFANCADNTQYVTKELRKMSDSIFSEKLDLDELSPQYIADHGVELAQKRDRLRSFGVLIANLEAQNFDFGAMSPLFRENLTRHRAAAAEYLSHINNVYIANGVNPETYQVIRGGEQNVLTNSKLLKKSKERLRRCLSSNRNNKSSVNVRSAYSAEQNTIAEREKSERIAAARLKTPVGTENTGTFMDSLDWYTRNHNGNAKLISNRMAVMKRDKIDTSPRALQMYRTLPSYMPRIEYDEHEEPLPGQEEAVEYNKSMAAAFLSTDVSLKKPYLDKIVDELLHIDIHDRMIDMNYITSHARESKMLSMKFLQIQNLRDENPEYFSSLDVQKRTILAKLENTMSAFCAIFNEGISHAALIETFRGDERYSQELAYVPEISSSIIESKQKQFRDEVGDIRTSKSRLFDHQTVDEAYSRQIAAAAPHTTRVGDDFLEQCRRLAAQRSEETARLGDELPKSLAEISKLDARLAAVQHETEFYSTVFNPVTDEQRSYVSDKIAALRESGDALLDEMTALADKLYEKLMVGGEQQ